MEHKRSICQTEGIQLLSLFRFNDFGEHSYYGAVMKSELGPGHYMAYCGTTNTNNGFFGVTDTSEADNLAHALRVESGEKIVYFGHGVTFSDASLLEEIMLCSWWIGTDYQEYGKVGGSYTTALGGCESLYNLMVKASDPFIVNAALERIKEENAAWH